MSWVENLKLRSKLVLVLLLPVLCLLVFSAYLLNNEWNKQKHLENLAQSGKMADKVTGLIHELQLERGHSATFLKNKDNSNKTKLLSQRSKTDQAWKQFNSTIQMQQQTQELEGLSRISHEYVLIEELRSQIDQQQIKIKPAVDKYSIFINMLFNQLEDSVARINNPTILRFLNGYLSLSQAKELAGKERGIGSLMILSPDLFYINNNSINVLAAEQNLLLQISSSQAPAEVVPLIKKLINLDCVRQFKLERFNLHKKTRPTAERWFKLASCRIEQLRKIELAYIQSISVYIKNFINEARMHLYLILAVTLVPIFPSLILIFLVDRNINSVVRWLLNSMQLMSKGNFNISQLAHSKDELGQLSAGLNQLSQHLSQQESSLKQLLYTEKKNNQELYLRTEELKNFAIKIASGDLRPKLKEDVSTMSQLNQSLNQMVKGLSGLTLKIRHGSSTIKDMVSELHQSINDQSSGASEQASSVNETVTTLEQLRTTSGQTLEKAKNLGSVAEKARNEGEKGRHAIDLSISDMKVVQNKMDAIAHTILNLNDWIARIGEITTSVQDIARQLRLISLNAAIEASNAGDAGKGFAVVASEVKQLAERSHKSTLNVQNILQEIRRATDKAVMATEEGSKGVEKGVRQIQNTASVVRNLESVVGDTSMASRQIVIAVNQEVVGIEQISAAVKEIHAITEKFAGTAELSRNAVQQLTDLVKHLDDTVNQYQL